MRTSLVVHLIIMATFDLSLCRNYVLIGNDFFEKNELRNKCAILDNERTLFTLFAPNDAAFFKINDVLYDLDELRNGLPRREGTFGAVYWWMVKIGQSIALALGGLVLSMVGFDAKSSIQAAETMHNLRLADIVIPSFTAGLAVLIMWNYSLNEDRVSNIKKELEARRAERNNKLKI